MLYNVNKKKEGGIVKKSIYIIPVLILVLILSFAPACGEAKAAAQELLEACTQGNLEDAKRLLEKDADVNAKDDYGNTALIIAIREDHTEISELLIANGANVNAKANNDKTALMSATEFDQTGIPELLIDNGADVNAKPGQQLY